MRPGLARDLAHQARRDRVVAHRLDRVLLHQVHVLVRGRMEDDRGPVLGEHLAHPLALLAVGEHRDGVEHVAVLDELTADLEEVVLGVIEQHQPARTDARDLAAELGADRAAGAGDEHDAAGQVAAYAVEVHAHRLAAEHVLDPDRAHLPRQQPAARLEQLEHRRHRAHRHAALAAGGDHARAHRSRRGGHRDQHLVGLDVLEHARQLLRRAEHGQPAVDPRALLARIVVDEADRPVAQIRVAQDLAQQQPAAVAGTDDQHGARVAARAESAQRALVDQVDEEARAADEDEHQQPVEHQHAGRHGRRREASGAQRQSRLHDRHVGKQRQRRDHARLRDLQVVALARVAHPVPVEAEQREHENAADDHERDRALEQVRVQPGDVAVEAQQVREVVGERYQPGVQGHLGQAVAMERESGRRVNQPAHLLSLSASRPLSARHTVDQQVGEELRIAPHALAP